MLGDTTYCVKRGIENIYRIMKENELFEGRFIRKEKEAPILPTALDVILDETRVGAIKEFAENLKDRLQIIYDDEGFTLFDSYSVGDIHDEIDSLLTEMIGENK